MISFFLHLQLWPFLFYVCFQGERETTNSTRLKEAIKEKRCAFTDASLCFDRNDNTFPAATFSDKLFLFVSVCVCLTCTIRIQPVGLVERIQAIAQNMSDMAVRVEQILQRSISSSRGKKKWKTHVASHAARAHTRRIPSAAAPLHTNPLHDPSNLEATTPLCPRKPGCQAWVRFKGILRSKLKSYLFITHGDIF